MVNAMLLVLFIIIDAVIKTKESREELHVWAANLELSRGDEGVAG
jgi:hypothetical protein